nr:Asp-tRNA(Asn)/Glu-tRNA(Gln) amidotransferase subunit GatC [Enemella evansiae]
MKNSSGGPQVESVSLTADDVARLGRLARIELSAEELGELAPQLSVILESVATVNELDTSDVPPTSHPEPLTNVFRPDENTPSLPVEEALAMAPAAEDDRFRVPRILGESA